MSERPMIEIQTGSLAGKRFKVPEAGLKLGRASINDIHLDDIEMSRSHCLFEREGEDGLAVLDLASANGTFVNGERLGAERRVLAPGDEVVVGETCVKVVGSSAASVDLGLGGAAAASASGAEPAVLRPASSRLFANLFWVAALLCVAAAAIVLVPPLLGPAATQEPDQAASHEADDGAFTSFEYEKVDADATHIFRFALEVDASGRIHAVCDDVPGASRHIDKSAKLGADALAQMSKTLDECGWEGLDDFYAGTPASGVNRLGSWRMRVVRGGRTKEVVVENTQAPEPFRAICETVEAFSRNELGIWAVQYSAEKLREMSDESARTGDQKMAERDVEYGNLSAAIDAYADAVFYLETVDPKPESYSGLVAKLEQAKAELDKRYRDRRFLADKAINQGDWGAARNELLILCEIVPKRDDPRHVEAAAKLVDVEKRSGAAGRGVSR